MAVDGIQTTWRLTPDGWVEGSCDSMWSDYNRTVEPPANRVCHENFLRVLSRIHVASRATLQGFLIHASEWLRLFRLSPSYNSLLAQNPYFAKKVEWTIRDFKDLARALLRLPKLIFLHCTAVRSACSARLLVGSTPWCLMKTKNFSFCSNKTRARFRTSLSAQFR